jgi:hypothetical protein
VLFQLVQAAKIDKTSGELVAGYPTYWYQGDRCLPVFTSPESLFGGLKACASTSPEADYVGHVETDPIDLVEIVGALEAYGLKSLVFDPPMAPDGKVWNIGASIPVGEYRKAIEEIRPAFERLSAEAVEKFCEISHLEKEPFVRWPRADAEAIAADLLAQIAELLSHEGH